MVLNNLRKSRPYTHCEVDPQATLGIAASLIPHPENNQSARNTFQAAMSKQAMGIYHSNHLNRFDGKTKVLAYPTRTLYESQLSKFVGLNSSGQGTNVMLAFGTTQGYTQEDAFVINKAAIDVGLFRNFKYIQYRAFLRTTNSIIEKLGKPHIKVGEDPNRYKFINDNGLPTIGAYLKQDDVVIGIIRTANGEIKNASVKLKVGEEGIVDKIYVSNSEGSTTIVTVKLRMMRRPVVGDKFAGRFAQKGTIGLIVSSEDMPRTADGTAIDMIVNPHSVPSRMTMSYLQEIIASTAGVLTGERQNASAFRPFDFDEFRRILKEAGYDEYGYHVVYSGTRGLPLKMQMFTGPCFIQTLKHQVKDKIQARSKGAVKANTRQPTKGRSNGGGMRFGEMERDNALSHGATYFAQERLCTVSDAYPVVYCIECGAFALTDTTKEDYICKYCQEKGKFAKAIIPYAYKLLTHYLAALGLFLRIDLDTEKNYRETLERKGKLAEENSNKPFISLEELEENYIEEEATNEEGGDEFFEESEAIVD
jgi:DNA-directed RNA polymerase II subunit RPB2